MRRSAMRSAANRSSTMRTDALRNDRFDGRVYGYEALSSVANRSITINGETQAPAFMYLGKSGADPWTAVVGDGVAKVENGADITYGVSAGTKNVLDKCVTYAVGDYHKSANTTQGDAGTEDLVFEFGGIVGGTEKWMISKMPATYAAGYSINIGSASSSRILCNIRSGGASVIASYNTLAIGQKFLAHCILDRSGNGRMYVNNVSGSAAAIHTASASLSNSDYFCLGGTPRGNYSDSSLGYAAMWKFSDVGTDNQAAWVASRWALFGGFA